MACAQLAEVAPGAERLGVLGAEHDLGRRGALRDMYQTVLREATRFTDLTTYLNGTVLVEVWPELFLPKGVRVAWEDHHPALRRAAATSAA
jgi:hypothetical protein